MGQQKARGQGKGYATSSRKTICHTHTHTHAQSTKWAVGVDICHYDWPGASRERVKGRGAAVANADRTNWFAKQAAPSPASTLLQPPSNYQKNTHK